MDLWIYENELRAYLVRIDILTDAELLRIRQLIERIVCQQGKNHVSTGNKWHGYDVVAFEDCAFSDLEDKIDFFKILGDIEKRLDRPVRLKRKPDGEARERNRDDDSKDDRDNNDDER